ncbi:MAG: hypothetical protein CL923_04940 [Deltaproteobacteria bacterium]|jgi:hypothetical protein|nr:hypothetical protein [Deltaproteobacteria bacterium]MDP7156733.1 hypothetical protein [SAR324 cluster bacterium]|tara:strand:- start:88 stop:552 length:465 start_codon:yes stop_codon:yes gene_type:complete
MMELKPWLSWDDIRNAVVALFLVILPTLLLNESMGTLFGRYELTGTGLWNLHKQEVPETVIAPLHELRKQPFYFRSSLIDEIRKQVPEAEYAQHQRRIHQQIAHVSIPHDTYVYLALLCTYYVALAWVAQWWNRIQSGEDDSSVEASESSGNSS